MPNKHTKQARRQKIRYRIRKKIKGTAAQPRLCVRKTNTAVYLQLINDTDGHTLVALDTRRAKGERMALVEQMGKTLVAKAKQKKIGAVCYDRSGYLFHGIVKKLFETVQLELKKTTTK